MKALGPNKKWPQLGPSPLARIVITGASGSGQSRVAEVLIRQYQPYVDRVYLISSTIDTDQSIQQLKEDIKQIYKDRSLPISDPEINPFRSDVNDLGAILDGMSSRTREAESLGSSVAPCTAIYLDDLGFGGGLRYNAQIERLFQVGRHSFGIAIVSQQSYRSLSRAARLQASHLAIMRNVGTTEISAVLDENSGRPGLAADKLLSAFKVATKDRPFGYLWLALNNPEGMQMWSGLTKQIRY